MQSTGIMGNLNKYTPGPGAYELKTIQSPVAFSMSIRTANYDPAQTELKKVPGAGTYPIASTINEKG